jgi:hypothetical protein
VLRAQGKLRSTGHKNPAIHIHFDTVQMPINVMDTHYESFRDRVPPVAQRESIAVLRMKPMGNSFMLESRTVSAIDCLN